MIDDSSRRRYPSAVRVNQIRALLKLVFASVLLLLLSGCILPLEPESRGVELSEAMESSAKGDRRDLGGSRSYESRSSDDVAISSGAADSAGSSGAGYDESEHTWKVLVDVTHSFPFDNEIQGITHFRLTPLSLEDENTLVGLYVGSAIVELESGSLPDLGTKRPWILEAGVAYRRYLNPSHTAFNPYVAGSIGYQMLNWDYSNPIVAGGDTIESDSLYGIEGSVAFGVSTRRDSRVSLFGEVGVGGTVFYDTTREGFENDVFDDFGFFSVKGGLNVGF